MTRSVAGWEVRVYAAKILIYAPGGPCRHLAYHRRQRTKHQWFIQLKHFLPTLRKKPSALLGSRAWKTAGLALRGFHEAYFEGRTRAFIDLLLWAREEHIDLGKLQAGAARMLAARPHLPVDPDAVRASVRADLAARRRPSAAAVIAPPIAIGSPPSSTAISDRADAQLSALQNLFFNPITTST